MNKVYQIKDKVRVRPGNTRVSSRIIILSIVLIITIILVSMIYNKFFRADELEMKLDFPGSMTDSLTFGNQKSTQEMKKMFLLKLTDNGGVLEYYQIAGKAGNPPARISDSMIFDDQLELLSFYAEQKNEKEFNKMNNWLKDKFQTDDGFFVRNILSNKQQKPDRTKTSDGTYDSSGAYVVDVASHIRYCRILIEAYDRFGKPVYLETAKDLAGLIYPLCKENDILPAGSKIALPQDTPTPDYAATPIPKSTITPVVDESKIKYMNALDLASIDLYALKILASIDVKWEPIYSNCADIVKKSVLNAPIPLFHAGYEIEKNSYIPYLYNSPEFIFEDQMKITLHLAEISELNESTFSYLKQQLFNTRSFFQRYSMLTGIASTENESITGYAMMARIARIRQDKELYELCIGRIAWNSATSPDSTIYQLPFRTMEDGGIRTFSIDVIRTLQALF